MAHRSDDSIVWIGYADFLTTLVVLFFIVTAVTLADSKTSEFTVIAEADSSGATSGGCRAAAQGLGEPSARVGGTSVYQVKAPRSALANASLSVNCDSLSRLDSVTTQLRGDSLIVVMRTSRLQQATISRLQGQANFARNSGKLSPEGVANVRQLGSDIKRVLRPGQTIAVQGHADDLEFGNTDIRNNLTLSSERAADAAHVLSSARHLVMIDPCQVIAMGYGSSRPLELVLASDSDVNKERKREVNRRIEFQIVDSPLTGTPCAR